MRLEVRVGRKTLAAAVALVRPLAGVDPLVDHHVGPLREGHRAVVAPVRPVSRVGPDVGAELALGGKGLRADGALERFLARVDAHVGHQVALHREGLGAVLALEGLLPRVSALVADHAAPLLGAVAAQHALANAVLHDPEDALRLFEAERLVTFRGGGKASGTSVINRKAPSR